MRTITYYLNTNQVVESDTVYPNAFSADDNTTQLIFDFTGTACATWEKWLDLTMSDYTKDVRSLGNGAIVTFNLGAKHTKKGLLQINPYAKNGTDKHGFPIYKLTIERQLNNSTVDASAQQSMIDYFDARLTVKAVNTTTLGAGKSATASVTVEPDGATYTFGVPQGATGAKGDDVALFQNVLSNGNDLNIIGVGDSLMENATSWLGEFLKDYAEAKGFNLRHATYNYGASRFNAWESTYTAGAERHIRVTKTSGARAIPKTSVAWTSPDLDIVLRFSLDDWNSGEYKFIFARYPGAGNRCWYVSIGADNKLAFYWSPDGTNLVGNVHDVSVASNVDDTPYWYRFTLDADNGSGSYVATVYTSTDGAARTSVDTKTGTATTVFDSPTAQYAIGASSLANTGNTLGKFYEIRFHNGIGGTNILPQPISTFAQTQTDANNRSYVQGTPTIYLYNTAVGGLNVNSYVVNTNVLASMPKMYNALVVYSLSHNDNYLEGTSYLSTVESVITNIKAKIDYPIVCVAVQPPKNTPAQYIRSHAHRGQQLISMAHKNNYRVIDFSSAFIKSGTPLVDLLNADGVHPNTAGKVLMITTAYEHFNID